MDCLEFRRIKLATPRALPDAAAAHLSTCDECKVFASTVDRFEDELGQAIRIPVDPGLADRVITKTMPQTSLRRRLYAVAAGLLLTVGMGLGVAYKAFAPDPSLVVASVDHVRGEPSAFAAKQQVSDTDLASALALSGGVLSGSFPQVVTYLHDCPVPGGIGKHLVLHTDAGRVTIITMPNQRVNWTVRAVHSGFITALQGTPRGSLAIVGETEAAVAAGEKLLQQFVTWRA